MKTLFSLFLLLALLGSAQAQFILHEDLLNRLNSIAPLPADAANALQLCQVQEGHVKTGSAMQNTLHSLEELIVKQSTTPDKAAATTQVNPTQTQADMAKSLNDPAMQQKIQNMSEAERLAFAMQIQQQAGTASTPAKPKAETPVAVQSLKALNNYQASSGFATKQKEQQLDAEWNALKQQIQAEHERIDAEMKETLAKLPTKSGGGEDMVYADPEKAKQVIIAHAQKHVEKQNSLQAQLKALLEKYKLTYTPYISFIDAEVKKVGYGDQLQSSSYRQQYHQAQITSLQQIQHYMVVFDEMIRIQASPANGLNKARQLTHQTIYEPIQLFEI